MNAELQEKGHGWKERHTVSRSRSRSRPMNDGRVRTSTKPKPLERFSWSFTMVTATTPPNSPNISLMFSSFICPICWAVGLWVSHVHSARARASAGHRSIVVVRPPQGIKPPNLTNPPQPTTNQPTQTTHREGQVADEDRECALLPLRVERVPPMLHVVLHLGAQVVGILLLMLLMMLLLVFLCVGGLIWWIGFGSTAP